jgi:hypothetical protein
MTLTGFAYRLPLKFIPPGPVTFTAITFGPSKKKRKIGFFKLKMVNGMQMLNFNFTLGDIEFNFFVFIKTGRNTFRLNPTQTSAMHIYILSIVISINDSRKIKIKTRRERKWA